jgi:hypothetical protein
VRCFFMAAPLVLIVAVHGVLDKVLQEACTDGTSILPCLSFLS